MREKNLTFTEHLAELRRALIISALAVLVGIVIGVIFSDYIDMALRWPIRGILPEGSDQPIYLGLFEPIFYRLKLGFLVGVLLASPVVFWQLWWFVSPGLYDHERRMALPFIISASVFFLGGAAFCYFVVLPNAAAFSVAQMTEGTKIVLSLKSYLSNAAMFMLAFGVVFETPVLVFLLCWIGIVSPYTLGKWRKYVFLLAFVVAAIITPTPDAFNQTVMALPIYVLYELGLLAGRMVWRRKHDDPAGHGRS